MENKEKIDRNYDLTHILNKSGMTRTELDKMCEHYVRLGNMQTARRQEIDTLYQAAKGLLEKDNYKYLLNPLNTENEKYTKFPAQLRNYNVITPIISSFVGETSKRVFGASVTVGNPNAENKKKEALSKHMKEIIDQDVVNKLNQMGLPTGVPSQETENYSDAKKKFEENYDDSRALQGQEALDYIKLNVEMQENILALMYDWVVCGTMATFKDVYLQDVIWNPIDVRDIAVIGWGTSNYAEDAEAVVYSSIVSGADILLNFAEDIQEHEDALGIMKYLDRGMIESSGFGNVANFENMVSEVFTNKSNRSLISNTTQHTLQHAVWSMVSTMHILNYYDELGGKQSMYVDSSYSLDVENGDISLEPVIVREWFENYKVDDKYYLGGGRGAVQRHLINNLASCKLPYNVVRQGYRADEIECPVKQMIVYQELINVFHYRWELLIAQNKDKIMALPLGIIPSGDGWSEDKFLYFMESMKFLIYDETAPNAQQFINGIKAIDMSMGNAFDQMWQNILALKQECWDLVGMNRQRYGNTYASDGKGVNDQALAGSAAITAPMFFQFDKFLEKEYRGLLDLSKNAFANGKKGSYINSEGKKAWFSLSAEDALDYVESDFNVFAINSVFEADKNLKAEQLLLTLAQNKTPPDALLEVLDSDTMAKKKFYVKQALAAEKAFQQSLAQQEQAATQAHDQAAQMLQDSKNQTDIRVAEIQAGAKVQAANIAGASNVQDTVEQINDYQPVDTSKAEANIAKSEDTVNKNNSLADAAQLKREDNANKLAIAKENKNKYDRK